MLIIAIDTSKVGDGSTVNKTCTIKGQKVKKDVKDISGDGAIAWKGKKHKIPSCCALPKTGPEVWELIENILKIERLVFDDGSKERVVVYIEKLPKYRPMPKNTQCPHCHRAYKILMAHPASTMQAMGYGAGYLRSAIDGRKAKPKMVTPQEWQKGLGIKRIKGTSQQEWKNQLKCRAQQLYPQINVTLKTADALLILHYAEIQEGLLF